MGLRPKIHGGSSEGQTGARYVMLYFVNSDRFHSQISAKHFVSSTLDSIHFTQWKQK